MGSNSTKEMLSFVNRRLVALASKVDHKVVIKHIYGEVEISFGYFMLLSIANLIALSGLLLNSLPVIIGAMLISPLMGPILGFGYAFVTGDMDLFNKAVKKISLSIALTLLVAAIATFISPIKDITGEIAARTRPNLYDLIIAFLSGTAGAVAFCTRKGYVTIVPGVAIATAVIPPLSVSGFGVGIWSYQILLGSLLLFFTNFVAITIATGVVFYIYGFKPSIATETEVAAFKKRAVAMGVVLVIISIPLVYTLHSTVKTARLRVNMYNFLKREFEREKKAKITNFSFTEKDGAFNLFATVNTENYLKDDEIFIIENGIKEELTKDVKLYVDQVLVRPGKLTALPSSLLNPAVTPQRPAAEILKTSREATIGLIRKLSGKVEKIIAPFTVTDFSIGFSDKTSLILISLKIKRDEPLTQMEIGLLERVISDEFSLPVSLSIETVPFVQSLIYDTGETSLPDEMKKHLEPVKEAFGKSAGLSLSIEAFPAYSEKARMGARDSRRRIEKIKAFLIEEYKIPEEKIKSTVHREKKLTAPTVKISISLLKDEAVE